MADAAKKDAKKGGGDEKEPSMEEILHSIRNIIAEDGDEKKPVNAEAAPAKPANGTADKVPGSDVLELTEMMKEEPATAPAKEAPAVAAAAAAPAEAPKAAPVVEAAPPAAAPTDVLNKIDEALGANKPAAPVAATGDTLLSNEAASAATSSIKKLKVEEPLPPLVTTPSPSFGNGATVEDMVMQMLRPLVKSWLDANLPAIVERIVEREVRKITRQ